MKYLKLSIIAFVLTTLLSTMIVQANVKGYANVTIPRFSGQVTVGTATKDYYGAQQFEKTTCKDKVSGNEMAIQVQTYCVNYGTYVPYVDAPKGVLITISSSNHLDAVTYSLNAKAKNSFITEGSLYGTWVLG